MPTFALHKPPKRENRALKSVGEPRPAVNIGERIKEVRLARHWTLDQASREIGLSRSAISKIERNEMSPTFQAMQKLAQGFGLDLIELLNPQKVSRPLGRRSVTRRNEGARHAMPHYEMRLLTGELKNTAFMAAEIVVKARSLDEFEDWDRHDNEDMLYVLSGRLILYTEHYTPVSLQAGDAVYFDARLGHLCLSQGRSDARVLWVTAPIGSILRNLAQ